MKKVVVLSAKGGVGKSTVSIGLARALRDKGYKTGLIDCDFTCPNSLEMLNSPNLKPRLMSDCVVVPPEVEGLKLLSWGMIWKEGSAVQVEDRQVDENDLRTTLNLIKSEKYNAAIKYLEQLIENPGGATYYVRQLFDEGVVDWGNTDFLIIDTAPTTCLPANTFIYTTKGAQRLSDIKVGDEVYSFDGKIERKRRLFTTDERKQKKKRWYFDSRIVKSKVQQIIPQGKDQIYEIKVWGRKIRANSNHPFLVIEREKLGPKSRSLELVWKKVEDLKEGDYVIITKSIPVNTLVWLPKVKPYKPPHGRLQRIPTIPRRPTEDFARLVGYYLGDGSTMRGGEGKVNGITFSEPKGGKYREKYITILRKVFNLNNENDIFENNGEFGVYSVLVGELFQKLGLDKRTMQKEIPQWAFELTLSQRKALIEGFIDADGHWTNNGNANLGGANKSLIESLHELAIYSGFRVTNIWEAHKPTNFSNGKICHAYGFEIISRKSFRPRTYAGFELYLKKNKDFELYNNDYFGIAKVVSIKSVGNEDVFDLTLNRHHNFIANGFVVHNSGTIRAVAEVHLDGSIIVTQPSKPSLADVSRTIDMLRKKKVPIYGLILNMLGRFELKEKDIIKFCQQQKLPLIHSIPFLKPNSSELKEHFSAIADYVLSNKPVVLEEEKVGEEWKGTVREFERVASIIDVFRSKSD